MRKNFDHFFILLFLVGEVVSSVIGVQATKVDNDKQIQTDLFYMRHFDTSSIVHRILSQEWTENHGCLLELDAIKNGLQNHEEWAIKGTLDFQKSSIKR